MNKDMYHVGCTRQYKGIYNEASCKLLYMLIMTCVFGLHDPDVGYINLFKGNNAHK